MTTGETYNEIERGIIIQNNDPDNMGRVKVFVPRISMTLYEGWNEKVDEDKFFKYPSDLDPTILKRLKESLPWAEVLHPIFGHGGQGYYWSENNYSSVEDSANIEIDSLPTAVEDAGVSGPSGLSTTITMPPTQSLKKDHGTMASNSYNWDEELGPNIGGNNLLKPSTNQHESQEEPSGVNGDNTQLVYDGPPMRANQGNQPKGIMSIPEVGNPVYVKFLGGDPQSPIVIGAIYSREEQLSNSGASEKETPPKPTEDL